MSRLDSKSRHRSLRADKSNEGPSSSSGSASYMSNNSRSYGLHQNVDPNNTQADQKQHKIVVANFDDVVQAKPALSCHSTSLLYSGLSFPIDLFSLFFLQESFAEIENTCPTALLFSSSFKPPTGIAAISARKKAQCFLSASKKLLIYVKKLHRVTSCSIRKIFTW